MPPTLVPLTVMPNRLARPVARRACPRALCLAVLCLGAAADARAQRIFHDAAREATAQNAADAAKEVTSGALFETMLRNVDAQAKLEVDTILAQVREQMRAQLTALEVWFLENVDPPDAQTTKFDDPASLARFLANSANCPKSVECMLRALRIKHEKALNAPALTPDQLNARLAEIKKKQDALKAQLEALKKEAEAKKDPLIDQAFALLDEHGDDVLEFANKVVKFGGDSGRLKGAGEALTTIGEGLDQVIALYKALSGIWKSRGLVSVDPVSLRPPPEQAELQLLAIEQDHLKTRARIEARRQIEVGAALDRVTTAMSLVTDCGVARSTELIEITLRNANDPTFATDPKAGSCDPKRTAPPAPRERLRSLVLALHETAAATAQVDAAGHLATIRLADEERRYSVRRSAVNARTYDLTIQAAVQRLALYWKGGIKPTELAQFAFYVANTIALPAIAIKQD